MANVTIQISDDGDNITVSVNFNPPAEMHAEVTPAQRLALKAIDALQSGEDVLSRKVG